MSSGSSKRKKAESLQDLTAQFEKTKTSRKPAAVKEEKVEEAATPAPDMSTNTFFKIVIESGLSPEQKKNEVAKALTFAGTKEENKTRLAEFEAFKAFLQSERKRMASEIIKLTDTKTFSELKSVIDDMNSGLLEFEEKMGPLTDILDAVYTLRTGGDDLIFEAFREIREEKETADALQAKQQEQQEEMKKYQRQINQAQAEIEALQTQRSWFGFGGVRQDAQDAIKAKKAEILGVRDGIKTLSAQIQETKEEAANSRASQLREQYGDSIDKLKELLDISSEDHQERQKALVTAAESFIRTSDVRISSVLGHLEGMDDQIDNLFTANGQIRNVYAILNDATKEATQANVSIREGLKDPEGDAAANEGEIAKMEREETRGQVDTFIKELTTTSADTAATLGDLSGQRARILTMRDQNQNQVAKTRTMHNAGVGGVADRLSTVLQGVSMAALSESSEIAGMTLQRMNEKTNVISAKQALQVAMGIQTENDKLAKAIEDLASYGDVVNKATQISREGFEEQRKLIEEMQKTAADMKKQVEETLGVSADVVAGTPAPANDNPEQKKAAPPSAGAKQPFKFGM